MRRVAIAAPTERLRAALVAVAGAGTVELDHRNGGDSGPKPHAAVERLHRLGMAVPPVPALARDTPDLDALEDSAAADLLAGEAQLEEYAESAVRRGSVSALAGWCPEENLGGLATGLRTVGGVVVPLPVPRGVDPPTMLRDAHRLHRSASPLVSTYGTVPYADVDPTLPAGIAYVVMFGVMFGDVGHGLLLFAAALLLRSGRIARLSRLRAMWPFVAGAGLTSMAAGLLYGEFFGPTGVVPVLWLAPLNQPIRLLASAVVLGGGLLAVAYGIGIVNRWREGGPGFAVYAASGVAGAVLFCGVAVLAGGVYAHLGALVALGGVLAVCGVVAAGIGLYAASGGGATGAVQTGVQLFDVVVRLGSNIVSFARLAAFGLTHAALGALVWEATRGLAHHGAIAVVGAVLVFVIGNAATFALEALIAAVQALRLEYYELFSRVFEIEGRPFHPWHVPVKTSEATS
jgi:V/A-type H+-transporting ATPase subunit I